MSEESTTSMPYRTPETPVAPRRQWEIGPPGTEGGNIVAIIIAIVFVMFWGVEALAYIEGGATPGVLRGLHVGAVLVVPMVVAFVRRVPRALP